MKDYFIRLFNYDQYTNQKIAEIISTVNDATKAIPLMGHLLSAQQIWLSRCKGETAAGYVLWPDWKADTFEQLINDNSRAWLSYLNTLTPADLEKNISYKNSMGTAYQNKLTDILAHVINHGTHHRAQIGQQLKFSGAENLPYTDYILFARS